jgi:hypothetical protein
MCEDCEREIAAEKPAPIKQPKATARIETRQVEKTVTEEQRVVVLELTVEQAAVVVRCVGSILADKIYWPLLNAVEGVPGGRALCDGLDRQLTGYLSTTG